MFGGLLGALIALKIAGFDISIWWYLLAFVGYVGSLLYHRIFAVNSVKTIIEHVKFYLDTR